MAKIIGGQDYYWYLPGKKKPFMGTTLHVAEVLRVAAMEGVTLQGGRTVQQVRNDFKPCYIDVLEGVMHDPEILEILDAYIKNGYGDELLRNLLANNQETHIIESRLAKERAAKRQKKKTPA